MYKRLTDGHSTLPHDVILQINSRNLRFGETTVQLIFDKDFNIILEQHLKGLEVYFLCLFEELSVDIFHYGHILNHYHHLYEEF